MFNCDLLRLSPNDYTLVRSHIENGPPYFFEKIFNFVIKLMLIADSEQAIGIPLCLSALSWSSSLMMMMMKRCKQAAASTKPTVVCDTLIASIAKMGYLFKLKVVAFDSLKIQLANLVIAVTSNRCARPCQYYGVCFHSGISQ